jgi:hypothetical protein
VDTAGQARVRYPVTENQTSPIEAWRLQTESLIKNNVARADDLAGGKIETLVALLRRRVTTKTHAAERGDNL